MKKILPTIALILFCIPASAQNLNIQGDLQLDIRNKLGFDYPYQRWDTIHTAALHLQTSLKDQTSADLLVQRRLFSTRIVEAKVEHPLSDQSTLRLGLQRLPFGIYDWQETYRSGLIDYPMPRVDYGESGMDQAVLGLGGIVRQGRLQAEGATFTGSGTTVWNDYTPFRGAAGRAQYFLPPDAIVGLSHCAESQAAFGGGYRWVVMNGLDLRYARPFLVLRGEAIQGTIRGKRYQGAYLDAYYRLPGLQDWTLTARAEQLKPKPSAESAHQATLGVRWTATPKWTLTLNWRGNDIGRKYPGTWVPQSGKHGDLLFQAYHTIPIGR